MTSVVVRSVTLLAAGLLAGAGFDIWLLDRSFVGSASFYAEYQQFVIRAYTVPLPALSVVSLVFGLMLLYRVRRHRLALGLTVAGIIFIAWAV